MPPSPQFSWLTTENKTYIRGVIEQRIPQWSTGPKWTQVDCWANLLQGIPVLLIASTGWGKTSAFYGALLVMQHLANNPLSGAPQYPEKPVVLIVTPLVELGNGQAKEMEELGIAALAINYDTLYSASEEGISLYDQVKAGDWSVVLIGPERLVSKEFETVIKDKEFLKRLVLLGVDEAHLVDEWGKDFRQAYHQIGTLRKRLPTNLAFVAVTATLAPGRKFDEVCSKLALKKGKYHLIRLSSERNNVRTIIRELSHGLGGYSFPDISWVFKPGSKAVVYCSSIDLCFRVALYGWSLSPSGTSPLRNVRIWDSITSAAYNACTLKLFREEVNTTTIIATVAFGLGMNVRIITDAVNLGLPDTIEALVQQNGRAGRDLTTAARGWTYVEKSVLEALPAEEDSEAPPAASRKQRAEALEPDVASLLRAHISGQCLVAEINRAMGNNLVSEATDALKDCRAAGRSYPCSSCDVDWDVDDISTPHPQVSASVPDVDVEPPAAIPPQRVLASLDSNALKPLTKELRENALKWLEGFAMARWRLKRSPFAIATPPSCIWSRVSPTHILDHYHLFNNMTDIVKYLSEWEYLDEDGPALLVHIKTRQEIYKQRQVDVQALAHKRRKVTLAKKAAEAAKEKENASAAKENIPPPGAVIASWNRNGAPVRLVLGARKLNINEGGEGGQESRPSKKQRQ